MKKEEKTIQDSIAITEPIEAIEPRHLQKDRKKAWHLRKESKKPKILKAIITAELISVVLACFGVYFTWCRFVEVRDFKQAYSSAQAAASVCMDTQPRKILRTYKESLAEELYEYVWTTGKVEYRVGADMSYKSIGTLEKDIMVRRTGIMNNGWSRITVDVGEYYIPEDKLSDDIPESLPIASGIKGEYQKYALSLLPDFGWDSSELEPLIYLWNRESGWNPRSHNKRSGAHGIPQALPAKKMASEGSDYYTNAEPQIRWGLKYIAQRYGSPSAAWAHFCSRGWY